jgi:hypothetical protein
LPVNLAQLGTVLWIGKLLATRRELSGERFV